MNINLKKVISSVAALAMSLSCFTAFAADFTDVEATASYKAAIDELVALEIVNGYEDGSFKPENEITRAEVTKMVVAAMGDSYTAAAESSKGTSGFADVDAANHWASGFISVGVAQKFINGMGDGTFAPDSNVTYAQIVKMLVAALGYDSAAALAGGYPNGYLQIGAQIGVTAGVTGLGADTAVTRAHVAQLISNALDTPLVVVTGWSQNYVTGEPIAETDVMDGTEGKAYKTLLTENHNAYVVKGRVTGTHATGATEVGTVAFDVEYADNFDGVYTIDEKTNPGSTASIVAYVGDTNAEELLFTYAEALIAIDENDENTILAITPYGRNEIVEVAAKDFASESYAGSGNYNLTLMEFNKSETSTKTNKYEIAPDVKMYVNGTLVADGGAATPSYIVDTAVTISGGAVVSVDSVGLIDQYISGYDFESGTFTLGANEVGTVTLINSPAAGSTSLDRYYDVIMVNVPKFAIIEEVIVSGDVAKVIFEDFETGVGAYINIDTTDEDTTYSFYKNGEEVTLEDVAAGDVALLTYDIVGGNANASDYVSFELCDTVVEGMVTGASDGKYTINGEEYELYSGISGGLQVSSEYELKIDAAGRVVKAEELASAKNYGIIDRVSYSTNDDAYVARIIKADGTRESIAIKSTGVVKDDDNAMTTNDGAASQAFNLYNLVYGCALTANSQIAGASDTVLDVVANRVVSYRVNSKGELNTVDFEIQVDGTSGTPAEFKESSMKIGGFRLSEATTIIDATAIAAASHDIDDATTYAAADFVAATTDMFVDGESYDVIVADKGTDGCWKFALVLVGNTSIGLETGFAVVDSVATAVDEADGEVKTTLTVLDANSAGELKTYFVSEDVTGDAIGTPARGTVVALGIKGDVVVKYDKIFDGFAAVSDIAFSNTIFTTLGAGLQEDGSASDPFYRDVNPTEWDATDNSTPNGWARIGFGMILDKNGSTVTFGNGQTATPTRYSAPTVALTQYVAEANAVEFDLDADVNVYVVDNNYADKKDAGRISVGSTGSVMKTPGVKNIDVYSDSAATTAAGSVWNLSNVPNGEANYAIFKVVDGDITDIVVFVPAN